LICVGLLNKWCLVASCISPSVCSVMSVEGASGLAGSGGTRNRQEGANELAAKLGVLE